MAAEIVRIDIQVKDKTNPGLASAKKNLAGFEQAIKRTLDQLDKLNKTQVQLIIHAKDRASGVLDKIGGAVRSLAGKTWWVTVKAADLVTAPIEAAIEMLDRLLAISETVTDALANMDTKNMLEASSSMEQAAMQPQAAASGKATSNTVRERDRASSTTEILSVSAMVVTAGAVYINGEVSGGSGDIASTISTISDLAGIVSFLKEVGMTYPQIAAVVSAILALAGVVSGLYDIYKGFKSEDKEESRKSFFSAGTKLGMVGTGAAAGAAFGSFVPIVGTALGALVGAGAGGLLALTKGREVGEFLSEETKEGGKIYNVARAVNNSPVASAGVMAAMGMATPTGLKTPFGINSGGVAVTTAATAAKVATAAIAAGRAAPGISGNEDSARETSIILTQTDRNMTQTDRNITEDQLSIATIDAIIKTTLPSAGNMMLNDGTVAATAAALGKTYAVQLNETTGVAAAGEAVKYGLTGEQMLGDARKSSDEISEVFELAREQVEANWSTMPNHFEANVWGDILISSSSTANSIKETWNDVFNYLNRPIILNPELQNTGRAQGTTSTRIIPYAEGGILTKPHLGLVAEAGAEAIIPLSPSKRGRGLALWQQAGELLGVQQPYAQGSIMGESAAQPVQVNAGGGGAVRIENKVELHPEFVFNGAGELNEQAVVSVIKARIGEMADDISDEIAEKLVRIFANRPLKGGA